MRFFLHRYDKSVLSHLCTSPLLTCAEVFRFLLAENQTYETSPPSFIDLILATMPPETILITGARAPIALELARSFHRQGHRVIMADSCHWTIARWSNAVARYVVLPSPRYQMGQFKQALRTLIREEKITHFIPTCEEAFHVSAAQADFPCKVWTSDFELLQTLHHKGRFFTDYQHLLPIPETQPLNTFTTWAQSTDYVFKPCYSRFATATIVGKHLTPNHFPDSEKPHWIAQKRIHGKEICIYSIWDAGQIKAYAAYHPLYRAGKGSGIYFEPIAHSATFERVTAFGKHLSYTGQLCFDVILDADDQPYFLECNPRGTSGAHLLHEALAPAFLAEGVYQQASEKTFAIQYAMAILHPFRFFSRQVRAAQDVIFSPKDPLPFFLQALSLLEISYLKFRHHKTWLEATTGDIEYNGEALT